MTETEKLRATVRGLVDAIEHAIAAGDWTVDGANDPNMIVREARRLVGPERLTSERAALQEIAADGCLQSTEYRCGHCYPCIAERALTALEAA